jgi:hypothetical protein
MYYMTGLMNHLKRLQPCVTEIGGTAQINVSDMSMEVRVGPDVRRFEAQFAYRRDGRRHYSPTLEPQVTGFIGWRPHAARRWPSTAEKLVFKEYARDAGVRMPAFWKEPSDEVARFIIKRDRSSFGDGIRGPFERLNPANEHHRLAQGEFYEAFTPGRIAKAWYLLGELLCLELRPPPFVTGDGQSTLLQLASARNHDPFDKNSLACIASAQGSGLSQIVEKGRRIVVDFRYGSYFDIWAFANENVLETVRDTPLGEQFVQAGRLLLPAIPAEYRDTVVTMDAIVDSDDQAWFLELNSNPMIHPDAYPAMLRNAFPAAIAPQAASAVALAS